MLHAYAAMARAQCTACRYETYQVCTVVRILEHLLIDAHSAHECTHERSVAVTNASGFSACPTAMCAVVPVT